jgi:hypothetical protein
MQPWDGVSSVPRFTDWGSGGGCGFPHYSKDHKAAFTVVAAMEARGFWLSLKTPFIPGANYHAGFTEHNFTGWNSRADFSAEADNAQFAICLAALKAIGVVVPG